MIGLLDRLGSLVRDHSGMIQQYYLDYLKGAYKAGYEALQQEVRHRRLTTLQS
jgi:hypothetical protein